VGTEGIQEEAGTAKEKLDGQQDIVRRHLKTGTTWVEAEELATNRVLSLEWKTEGVTDGESEDGDCDEVICAEW